MVGDPIADFIIRIKNAGNVGKSEVTVPYSKLKASIAETMSKAGFIGNVEKSGKGVKKTLTIELLYDASGKPKITDVQRISKPGRRLYKGVKHIFPIKYGKGAAIYSTPNGILTDKEAVKQRVGGEELFRIW